MVVVGVGVVCETVVRMVVLKWALLVRGHCEGLILGCRGGSDP